MHQSRKEKSGIHLTVTRLTLRDLIEKTDLWVCRYLPYSYKIFYKLLQQNSLSRSRSRLNHSPSMRYEVEFKSSRYLSSPDGSRGKEEPVLEHWCCPGWPGLSQVEKQFVTFAFLFLSCGKCSSAAVSTPPETLSKLAAWGPLQKSQKCKYDVLLPSAWPWHTKWVVRELHGTKQLSQNYYGVFRERWWWCPSSTSWCLAYSFPSINTSHSPNWIFQRCGDRCSIPSFIQSISSDSFQQITCTWLYKKNLDRACKKRSSN